MWRMNTYCPVWDCGSHPALPLAEVQSRCPHPLWHQQRWAAFLSKDLACIADTAVCMDICLEGMGFVFTPRNLLSSEWLWRTSKIWPLLAAATTSGKHHQVKARCIQRSAPEPNTCSSLTFFFHYYFSGFCMWIITSFHLYHYIMPLVELS